MIKIFVTTPWVEADPSSESPRLKSNHPRFSEDYPAVGWTDATAQLAENLVPDPNLYVIEALVDDATLAQIVVDTNYEVLTAEEI